MRAVLLREFGPPGVLEPADVPEPVVRDGQVLIDVAYANITFVETQFRATRLRPVQRRAAGHPRQRRGRDGHRGRARRRPRLDGRRVVTSTGGTGGYAERVAVAADVLYAVPDGLALDDAVALLADGRTAAMLVAAAELRPRERVLVEAAAGGVGTLLVQLARAAGAEVVAAAGGERKLAVARELGAAVAVDYREPRLDGARRSRRRRVRRRRRRDRPRGVRAARPRRADGQLRPRQRRMGDDRRRRRRRARGDARHVRERRRSRCAGSPRPCSRRRRPGACGR